MVPISKVRSIEDLFSLGRLRPIHNGVTVIRLGSGKVALWERELEKRFGVKVTLFDRKIDPHAKPRTQGGAINGDFFDYKPPIEYDMAIFNSPKFSGFLGSESQGNFRMMAEILNQLLKPGGIGIIFSDQGSKTPIQDLERLFGVGNVIHLPALKGYNLGFRFPLASSNLGGEFFIIKKPLLDHPLTMVFHFEKERKIFWGRFLKSNEEVVSKVSKASLLKNEIQFWLSLVFETGVLGTGWEKKFKKNPIGALIYIVVEADRERMGWDQEIYEEAIIHLIRATDDKLSWLTEREKSKIWGQLAILEEREIGQIVEYLVENKVFVGGDMDLFLDRLQNLASNIKVEIRAWKGKGTRLQIQLASIYSVLSQNGKYTIDHPEVRILDDIRDLLHNNKVTEVEERCVDALKWHLNLNDPPGVAMEAELILHEILFHYESNESKEKLVKKVANELTSHFKYRQALAWEFRLPHQISFFVERMTDSRIPSQIKKMARIVLEKIAEDAFPYLIKHFENGDEVSQLEIKAFFINSKKRIKPLLEQLRESFREEPEPSETDRKAFALIDRILRFMDTNSSD